MKFPFDRIQILNPMFLLRIPPKIILPELVRSFSRHHPLLSSHLIPHFKRDLIRRFLNILPSRIRSRDRFCYLTHLFLDYIFDWRCRRLVEEGSDLRRGAQSGKEEIEGFSHEEEGEEGESPHLCDSTHSARGGEREERSEKGERRSSFRVGCCCLMKGFSSQIGC